MAFIWLSLFLPQMAGGWLGWGIDEPEWDVQIVRRYQVGLLIAVEISDRYKKCLRSGAIEIAGLEGAVPVPTRRTGFGLMPPMIVT
jgi:hypothetical protein